MRRAPVEEPLELDLEGLSLLAPEGELGHGRVDRPVEDGTPIRSGYLSAYIEPISVPYEKPR